MHHPSLTSMMLYLVCKLRMSESSLHRIVDTVTNGLLFLLNCDFTNLNPSLWGFYKTTWLACRARTANIWQTKKVKTHQLHKCALIALMKAKRRGKRAVFNSLLKLVLHKGSSLSLANIIRFPLCYKQLRYGTCWISTVTSLWLHFG